MAVNAKYIHSSLAAWYLKENCEGDHQIEIMEFSINDDLGRCLSEIYHFKPDIVAFSCYIWNIRFIENIARDLKKLQPTMPIIAGGPEVSFSMSDEFPWFDYVICGEGERIFSDLIQGMAQKKNFNKIHFNRSFQCIHHLDQLKTPYTDEMLKRLGNRILYFESSRGCPFSCSYCLSSTFHGVRTFSLERVFSELDKFATYGIRLIKFVDRTFNCSKERADAIFSYILRHSQGRFKEMVFHFEVAADLFDHETLALLKSAPQGLIQFEIGLQTTNENTLKAINRKTDTLKVKKMITGLREPSNINLHLDLIAGLPGEDFLSFQHSFDEVYHLRPHMLQLGFLKLLKGTILRKDSQEWDIQFRNYPPYEFLQTVDLPFEEVQIIKGVEAVVDRFYNSHRFSKTLQVLLKDEKSPFCFYQNFYVYLKKRGFFDRAYGARECYGLLYSFVEEHKPEISSEFLKQILKYDFLKSDNTRSIPEFLKVKRSKSFYDTFMTAIRKDEFLIKYLPWHRDNDNKNFARMLHLEMFDYAVAGTLNEICTQQKTYLLFDYSVKDKVEGLYRDILIQAQDVVYDHEKK